MPGLRAYRRDPYGGRVELAVLIGLHSGEARPMIARSGRARSGMASGRAHTVETMPTTLSNRDKLPRMHATTILGVKRGETVAIGGDGQVTLGDVVLKKGARKIRLMHEGTIVAGFAGAVADALTLFGKFEAQLKAWDGNLRRAAVELAKEWRTDRYLRRLEAQLIVADAESILVLSGEGDVIEPDDGIVAIGTGAPFATAAAKALLQHTELDAKEIVEAAMSIAAEICIFTNDYITIESVQATPNDHEADQNADVVDMAFDDDRTERG
jgi:ATP-dependent HslUV protease subunit HslV